MSNSCNAMDCSKPGLSDPYHLLKFAQVHVHCTFHAIHPSHPLTPSSSALNLSSIRDFFNESAVCIRWPNYWNFNFSISPSTKYSGLISLKIDGLISLLFKGLSGIFSSNHSSVLCLLYGLTLTTLLGHWEDHCLDYTDFVNRIISLFFNPVSRFIIAFLPRSKHLLISWLQSPSAVILEPKKRKPVTTSIFSPSTCHEVMEPDAMILVI